MTVRRATLLAFLLPLPLAAQRPARPAHAALSASLDSIARAALVAESVPGLSVAVLRGRDTLLIAGYGSADLGLGAPVTPATTFRLSGPAGLMLSAALLQQVEAGRLRLDDDASRLLPDFPWQGRRVTVRQLMDATSGLPDYHYLGDAYDSRRAVPKAWDEVTALFAGLPFAHEPGAQWQWTISGFHLAGGLLERVTGMRYADYLRERIFAPAGLTRTFHCGDRDVTPGLARSYNITPEGFRAPPLTSATLHPYHASVCSTASDVATLARALRDGRLLTAASWRALTTAEGAARARPAPTDSTYTQGFGIRMGREGGHRWVGEWGSLMSFSSAVLDFPEDSLTVAVLANVGQAAAGRIARRLARAALGLAPVPHPSPRPSVAAATGTPLPADQHGRYAGTYVLRLVNAMGPNAPYQLTVRVFGEHGHLMIQTLGDLAVPLLALGEHVFGVASNPSIRFTFTVEGDRATALNMRGPNNAGVTGPRVTTTR